MRYLNGETVTDLLYTGQKLEEELGLYYYVARWYDPYLNRFLSPDSIIPDPGSSTAFDRYAYVQNNPLVYTDPSGHLRTWGGGVCTGKKYTPTFTPSPTNTPTPPPTTTPTPRKETPTIVPSPTPATPTLTPTKSPIPTQTATIIFDYVPSKSEGEIFLEEVIKMYSLFPKQADGPFDLDPYTAYGTDPLTLLQQAYPVGRMSRIV